MATFLNPVNRARAAQTAWAASQGIQIDEQGYTIWMEDNLLQPFSEGTRGELAAGAGGEIGLVGGRGKLQALHASSALAVNTFGYWRDLPCDPLARSLDIEQPITSIQFERPFPTGMRGTPPHLDVTLTTADGAVIAIESKFLEPYPGKTGAVPFRETYFPASGGRWVAGALPVCQRLAESLRAAETVCRYLDAQQLLKHALGLASTVRERYALWYLWYDVGGAEGALHRAEIEQFSRCIDSSLGFRAVSYQSLIARLTDECGPEHSEYVTYMRNRYGGNPAAGHSV